jgi:hypothetical protein
MKTQLFFLILLISVAACSTKPKEKTESVSGEFLFYSGAAVLNTGSEIYGVVIDDMLRELHAQTVPVQKDSFDMVQVYVKGVISDNPNSDGWSKIVRVVEIDSVAPSSIIENQMIQIRTE